MANNNKCPQCGSHMPPNAPQGVCPQCLMKLGLPTGAAGPGDGSPDDRSAVAPGSTPPGGFIPPQPEDLANQFPQLEIIELLGQGGMGAVYKARQKQLDRLVALKILPPEVGHDPTFAERFSREARSLARLNHPNIVTVYDFGHTGQSLYYFIMEFVEGTDLRRVILGKDLAPAQALAIVPQICDALQYAHEEGIVHRDIKPENILLDKKGRVKIADFGLARLLDHETAALTLTQFGQRMGTPHYMAPEQIEHPHEVDHRADIYSLGVVFYEMLTGELPLGRFAPPSRKVHIDVRLDEVVLHSLEKEPARRYQQVSQVKTDVEAVRNARPDTEPSMSHALSSHSESGTVASILLAMGALTIASGILTFMLLIGVFVDTSNFDKFFQQDPVWIPLLIMQMLTIPSATLMVIGGFSSKTHSPAWQHIGAKLGIVPLTPAWLITMPLGFWVLSLLSRPRVKANIDTVVADRKSPKPAATHPAPLTIHEQVKGPAIGLLVVGFAGLLTFAARELCMTWLTNRTFSSTSPVWLVAQFLDLTGGLDLFKGIFLIVAALPLFWTRAYWLAVLASIVAMLPVGPSFLLGLPIGIWALAVLSRPQVKAAFAGQKIPADTDQSQICFSRKAIAGIACVPFFALLLAMLSNNEGYDRFEAVFTPTGENWGQWFFAFVVTALGIAAPFATTILGAVALADIRRSQGRIIGLPLALTDVLLFPLFFLDFGVVVLFVGNKSPFNQQNQAITMSLMVLTWLVLDYLIIRWAWRKAHAGLEPMQRQPEPKYRPTDRPSTSPHDQPHPAAQESARPTITAEPSASPAQKSPERAGERPGMLTPGTEKPRDTRNVLGIISLCTAIFGIVATILLWLFCFVLDRLGIQPPTTILTITYVGAEVVALVMGIVAWRSPYGKAAVGISTILLMLIVFLMPVRVETTSGENPIPMTQRVRSSTISPPGKIGGLYFPYGQHDFVEFDTAGPTLGEPCRRLLDLKPSEAIAINEILRKAYEEYLAIERRHTRMSREGDQLVVTIDPFFDEAESFLARLWDDLDRVFDDHQQEIAQEHFPLGRIYGDFKFGEPVVIHTITRQGNSFKYETKYEWSKGSAKSTVGISGSGTALPERYSRYWLDAESAPPPAHQ